jgi:hypothetical protein
MTTLRVQTKIAGVLANVTSVTLADAALAPTYGIRRTDTGVVVVAAGTPMPNVTPGVYEYEYADTSGVPYQWRFAVVYGGQTHIGGGSWTATITPAAAVLTLTAFDEILLANLDQEDAAFGEAVTVHPVGGADRSCTAIVTRDPPVSTDNPRETYYPVLVSLRNDAVLGISGAEWSNRFEITIARHRGSAPGRVRTVKAVKQDAARITWGCQ